MLCSSLLYVLIHALCKVSKCSLVYSCFALPYLCFYMHIYNLKNTLFYTLFYLVNYTLFVYFIVHFLAVCCRFLRLFFLESF